MVSNYEILFRLFLAAILGAVVGLEREVHGRPAGIRTFLLLCMGSALIMVVSELLFFKYEAKGFGDILRADPGRIAAQAITGIGFLGAGVILRYKDTIRGLTTAACVWVACAIGLAIGSGFYLFGATVTGLTLISLVGLKTFERRLKKDWYKEMTVVSRDEAGQLNLIHDVITRNKIEIVNFSLKKDLERKEVRASFLLRIRSVRPSREVLQEVFAIEGVKSVDLDF
ncbi:MAG: MgtC/SapB family protein [Deltaproteobacteria bacterium]|nr:MgtC/SapB family protein [Deltaproteobacteria bacterium]